MFEQNYNYRLVNMFTNITDDIRKTSNITQFCTLVVIAIACVASVPVRSERNFTVRASAKNGVRAKRWKEGDGGGERMERLPANPSILKNAHWFSRLSSLTD